MQRKGKCERCDYNFTRKFIVNIHSLPKLAKGAKTKLSHGFSKKKENNSKRNK